MTNLYPIAAAHCIQEKHSNDSLWPQQVRVLLGANDLNNPDEPGRSMHRVHSISLHDDWNAQTASYDADIAVLILKKEAMLNEYIQPINFIPGGSNISDITSGFIVGYAASKNDSNSTVNVPKILETPIVKNSECFSNNKNPALPIISSGRTFCGLISNNTNNVCSCNSGNGLIVTDGTKFYLSGIVSRISCYGSNADTFLVLTNVSKFIDWINGTN